MADDDLTAGERFLGDDVLPALDRLRECAIARGFGQDEAVLWIVRGLRMVAGNPAVARQLPAALEPFEVPLELLGLQPEGGQNEGAIG
jgi:hypothetical protein